LCDVIYKIINTSKYFQRRYNEQRKRLQL